MRFAQHGQQGWWLGRPCLRGLCPLSEPSLLAVTLKLELEQRILGGPNGRSALALIAVAKSG